MGKGKQGDQKDDIQEREETSKKAKQEKAAPELQQEFKDYLQQLGIEGHTFAVEWSLDEGRRLPYDVNIPWNNIKQLLNEEELKNSKDFQVSLYVAFLGNFRVNLKKKGNQPYHGLSDWIRIANLYEIGQGTQLQLWGVKKQASFGLLLVILDQEKLQQLKSARQIPPDIRTRILGSETASEEGAEICYIVKKELAKSDVKNGAKFFTIPRKEMENYDLLRDIQETGNCLHGITLIGPPDIAVVTVEVKWKPCSGLIISGAGWRKFSCNYGLQEGMQVKLWFFRRATSSSTAKDSNLGFAMLKIDGENPPEGRQLLPEFKTQLSKLKFAGEVLVKEWVLSEDNVSRKQHDVIIPSKILNQEGFLTEEQKQEVDMEVPLLVAFLGKFTVNLRKKRNKASYGLTDWIRIMDKYKLTQGTQLQLWAFRHEESSQLGFALIILTQEKLQGLRNARQIPEEIRARIMGFGAASEEEAEIIFVMERILHQTDLSVGGGFTIPKKDIENDFLRHNEIETFVLGISLIGPPIQEPENKEFKVKFTNAFSLTISGPDWRDFATTYKLQPGMLVRLWSFRKPSSSSDNDSNLGFALISPE